MESRLGMSSALATSFTKLVDCRFPVQCAPMPGVSTPQLCAAVSDAGGLGMIGAGRLASSVLLRMIEDVKQRTHRPFGVNFLVPFLDAAAVDMAARRAKVIEFFWGHPDRELVQRCHDSGQTRMSAPPIVGWQAGSLEEAMAAEEAGCDYVVAQSNAAGGHVRGQLSLLPLLGAVVEEVRIPVVAAGGIGSPRAMAAALTAGASAVRVGTRFVAATESGAHAAYKAALVAARAEDTEITEAFSGIWPNAPHRVLRSCIEAARALNIDVVGETMLGGQAIPIARLSSPCPTTETVGHVRAMALYAGQSVGDVRQIEPAGVILRELCEGAERFTQRVGQGLR